MLGKRAGRGISGVLTQGSNGVSMVPFSIAGPLKDWCKHRAIG